jgi:transposase
MPNVPLEVGSKYIVVEINEKGETVVEAVGFHGHGCKEATKQLEIGLGTVSSRKDKPEGFSAQGITLGR